MKFLSKILILLTLFLGVIWSEILAQLKCEITNDPAKVQIVYDDVQNFLKAMKMLGAGKNFEDIIQIEYIDKASPGLKEYIREGGFTANKFVEVIQKKQDQYHNLKSLPDQLRSQDGSIRDALKKLKNLIPDPVYLPIYYMVGISGDFFAQPSEYGIMVTISNLAEDPGVIKLALVHEIIHVQQALTIGIEEYQSILGPKMSLLALSIREGAADFLTWLSTGGRTLNKAHDYFIKNEGKLWERFKSEMNNRLPGDWMFKKPADSDQPRDLGYIMGSKIVEAYYNRIENKEKAVKDILAITDYLGFLKKSGYAEKFSDK